MDAEEKSKQNQNSEKEIISLKSIFWTFFRIGMFTLGGGLAMAAVLKHEIVVRRRWSDEDDFITELSTATIVPGVIAVNLAYLQGRRLRGWAGSIAAILGTVLPSFFIILVIAAAGQRYFSHPRVAAFFKGCALAVAGQLAFAGLMFGRKLLRNHLNIIVCAAAVLPVIIFKLHPLWAIIIAVGLGYLLWQPQKAADLNNGS